jgi:hypothetical protein
MYAPLNKIGQTIKCPDCHSVCEVHAPEERKRQASGPSLDGTEDFAMSDPGERPRYRPLVAPRGEYEILAALDPANVQHGWTLPEATTTTAGTTEADEFQLSAPVERPHIERPPVKLPEPDPEESLYDGRYDDGVIGDNVDWRQPNAWKRAPFVYGILGFLFQGGVISRLVMYSVGLAILLNLMHITVGAAMGGDPTWQVMAIFLSLASCVGMGFWLGPFSACCLAIVQDTANGSEEVGNWPPWDPTEWFYSAMYWPIAGLVSGIPGMLLTLGLFSAGLDPMVATVALSLPLPLSWLLLFPAVLYSMLAEASVMSLISKQTLRSYQTAGAGWVFFYMYSIVIFLLGTFAVSLALSQSIALRCVAACLLVPIAFLYARLLGRLMWFGNQQVAKFESQAEAS